MSVAWGIGGLALLVGLLLVWGFWRAETFFGVATTQRLHHAGLALLLLAVWLGSSAVAATTGYLMRFDLRPPPLMMLVVASIGLAAGLGVSRIGWHLAHGLPLSLLVGFQSFRLPLELFMHEAAQQRLMPLQMSFAGYNFDFLSGLSAMPLAILLMDGKPHRRLLWAWNVAAGSLLVAIATIAIASLPLFHAFGTKPEQLNTWITQFPYVWLPCVLVAAAVLGHVVLTRRLLER